MSTNRLKLISILLPALFMVGVIYVRFTFVPDERSLEGNVYATLAVALGAIVFSIFFFNIIELRESLLEERGKQIEALHESALALTTELNLQAVLQKVVELSRELLGAKYGALGVIDPGTNNILQFITAGISDAERARIGTPPKGRGLLGVISPGGLPLIVDDISKDQRSVGFPKNHPGMHSLLGVPIRSKGAIFGNLYVADKIAPVDPEGYTTFSQRDQSLLEKFATQAAIAIENAQLNRKTQELAVLHERERFGMALHDGIMQTVYAAGLSLQEGQRRMQEAPLETSQRIDQAINDLGQVLRDLRNYILGLRTGRYQGQDLSTSLGQMAEELHANTLMNVTFTPPSKVSVLGLDEVQIDELVHIAQEALTNIRKHAYARSVNVSLKRDDRSVLLDIIDDGVGFDIDSKTDAGGNGLRNMRERAEGLGAKFSVSAKKGMGTHIHLSIPIKAEKELIA